MPAASVLHRLGCSKLRFAQCHHTVLVRAYGLYILDLDGTIYRGSQALPHAVQVVAKLRKRGAKVRFLTNNSGQTRRFYFQKLQQMGFQVEENEIYSSAIGTATYCTDNGLRSLFVVGEQGLVETLRSSKLVVANADDDHRVQAKDNVDADAVVTGICKSFNYDLLSAAMQCIRRGGRFIATNTDATYPLEDDVLIPGAGAIVSSIQTCSGEEPFVVGKPNPFLLELVMRDAGIAASETLVVGDRYETDIESGIRAGCDTHLVLTGITKTPPPGQSFSEDLTALVE